MSISAFAFESDVSAERQAGQAWDVALNQIVSEQKINVEQANALDVSEFGPRQAGGIPEWSGDMAALEAFFEQASDIRNYPNPNSGDFRRKAAWLYVNDGCFAKAAHVSLLARNNGLVQPGKIYAFGDLLFHSPYARNGQTAYWSYHIAAAYRLGSTVYALDPAVSPGKVLTEAQWKSLISPSPAGLRISYCDSHSYSPYSTCVGGNGNGAYVGSMPQFLQLEWNNLIQLGYSPSALLGPMRRE
jgi:hypothetical protein